MSDTPTKVIKSESAQDQTFIPHVDDSDKGEPIQVLDRNSPQNVRHSLCGGAQQLLYDHGVAPHAVEFGVAMVDADFAETGSLMKS